MKQGMKKEAYEMIEKLKVRSKQEIIDPIIIAGIYSSMGKKEEADEWPEKAHEKRLNFANPFADLSLV
jgi:hypothetical protein